MVYRWVSNPWREAIEGLVERPEEARETVSNPWREAIEDIGINKRRGGGIRFQSLEGGY